MLTIRLNRVGKKNKAYFRIVLQEHTIAPGGRHIEVLGSYDPHMKKAVLKAEKIKEWIGKGAQPSDTAYNLFVKEGVLTGKKRVVKVPKKAVAEVPAEEKKEAPKEPADAKAMAEKEMKAEEIKTEEPKAEEVDKK
ncbi:MAG: 30S ribosomal protein S16 [Parcubacteria group bacterium]|jgi:small subunit ribosomal protein S16